MSLTALQVRNAKPGRYADSGNGGTKGLYLLVKPRPNEPDKAGAKSWVLRVVVNRKRCDFGLGSVDLVSLTEAREKAQAGRKLAKAGINPAQEWRRVQAVVPTFEEAARGYHREVEKAWRNGKHGGQWLKTLESYVFPLIGAQPVDAIDASAIQSALLPIWLTVPETARRVRQRIFVVLDYCKGKGWRETEAPARAVGQLMRGIKQPPRGNFAAGPYSELPGVMAKLRASAPSMGRYALRFAMLTLARSGEVRGTRKHPARWREIDWEREQWDIPGDRMKAGKPHSVPLVPEAMDILREVRGLFGADPNAVIFPGTKKDAPLSDATMAKAFRTAGGKGTVHGSIRSGFRDWAAEQTSFPGEWAEAALAHELPSKVEAAYRRTKFLEQRRDKLMPAWSSFLSGGSNVVRLVASS